MKLLDIVCKVTGNLFILIMLVSAIGFAMDGDDTNTMIALITSLMGRIVMVLEGDA